MTLPPDIAAAVTAAAAQEIARMAAPELSKLQLVSYKRAGELLGISEQRARRLLTTYIELGECTRRVRISDLQRLINERTFRHGCVGKTAGGVKGHAESVTTLTGVGTDKATASGTI